MAKQILTIFLMIILIPSLIGCAQTMHAIEHAKMTVTANMSDTIFLDAATLAKNRTAYVRVTNTSDMQEIAFEESLCERLRQKGIELVSDPSNAGYIIQANVLYMDYEKQGLTADGMLAGGFGGALAGAAISGDWKGSLAGGIVGGLAGAAVGSAFKVETFFGTVDVQIQEKVEGGVRGTMVTDATQGSASRLYTEREVKSDYQTYRTRIVAKAKKTNIDRVEAAGVISEKLAHQIAGAF
ncbi:MAG: complement resistance protein TraT [Nitrospirae bacterium]|nr:complement resistance protein TraT [Nitrospirota bacterium]